MNEAPSVSHELEEEQESLRLEAELLLNEAQPASTARLHAMLQCALACLAPTTSATAVQRVVTPSPPHEAAAPVAEGEKECGHELYGSTESTDNDDDDGPAAAWTVLAGSDRSEDGSTALQARVCLEGSAVTRIEVHLQLLREDNGGDATRGRVLGHGAARAQRIAAEEQTAAAGALGRLASLAGGRREPVAESHTLALRAAPGGGAACCSLELPQLAVARRAAQRCRGALRRWCVFDAELAAATATDADAGADAGPGPDADTDTELGEVAGALSAAVAARGTGAEMLRAARLRELASAAEEMTAELLPAVAALTCPSTAPGGGLAFPLRDAAPCALPLSPPAPPDVQLECFVEDGGVGVRLVAVAACGEPATTAACDTAQRNSSARMPGGAAGAVMAARAAATVVPSFLEGEGAGSFMLGHVTGADRAGSSDGGAGVRAAAAALVGALGAGSAVSTELLGRLGVDAAEVAAPDSDAAASARGATSTGGAAARRQVCVGQTVNCEGRWLHVCHVDVAWARVAALGTALHALQGTVSELRHVRERCLAIGAAQLDAGERACIHAGTARRREAGAAGEAQRIALVQRAEALEKARESALAARQLAREHAEKEEAERRAAEEREAATVAAVAAAAREAEERSAKMRQAVAAAAATAVTPVQSSMFDDFDVPPQRPKPSAVPSAAAAAQSSIFDDFDVPAHRPQPQPKPPAAAAAQSSIFDDFDVPAHRPQPQPKPPAAAAAQSSIFDDFDVPVQKAKGEKPKPATAADPFQSSIFDGF